MTSYMVTPAIAARNCYHRMKPGLILAIETCSPSKEEIYCLYDKVEAQPYLSIFKLD